MNPQDEAGNKEKNVSEGRLAAVPGRTIRERERAIPELETERLRLRGHRPEDFGNCEALWGDAEVTRYIGGKPLEREEVWARLLRYAGHWAWLGYGFWLVEEKGTGRFVGEVGYANLQRAIQPPLEGMPELGWALATSAQGKGYATEAVRAATEWGEQQFGEQQTACIIHPENGRSIRVAEKCEFRESHRAVYKGQPAIIFTRQAQKSPTRLRNLRKSE
jgi:RimJ/RimL family protein N-acetyltransferase